MRELDLGFDVITDEDIFIIAEIGSNHMGDPDLCEKMIIEAAYCGASAVKLQKRNNKKLFTKTKLKETYDGIQSYGQTYGEHREALDWFGRKEYMRFEQTAFKHGILLFSTPFDEDSADFLEKMDNPIYKIGSCDLSNEPLLRHVARFKKPMIISTGGASYDEIMDAAGVIETVNDNYAIMHCVSEYPNTDNLNLRNISKLREVFPDNCIGFSSHHAGIQPLILARSLGASIFEVHFTLNRGYHGTDHGFSLEPQGLRKLCEDIYRVDKMLGSEERHISEQEKTGFVVKMGKSLYLNRPMKKGDVIQAVDLEIRAPAEGMKPGEMGDVFGHALIDDVSTGQALQKEFIGDFVGVDLAGSDDKKPGEIGEENGSVYIDDVSTGPDIKKDWPGVFDGK